MRIDGDLFQHTKKLQFIEVSNGNFQNVGENLLSGLNALTNVWFGYNICTFSTITEAQCSLRCSLDNEVDGMRFKIDELLESIAAMCDRLVELEKIVREINARP